MITIKRKEDCVGCNACVQRCPKSCIAMHEDEQGFRYPKVDLELCINCGLCEKVCPVINQSEPRKPQEVYAAKNPDQDVVLRSSSGGIFTAIAKAIIEEGGVVFGARFNENWEVVHDYTETIEGLKAFQGSKYVQSQIGDTFKQAEQFLKAGKKVLFTGTPCQIAGLRLFLRKPYDNLLMVDVVCHGVPSPLVWRKYLDHITHQKKVQADDRPTITSINFRDKRNGWENYGISVKVGQCEIFFEPQQNNLYMQMFLKDLDLRPSCNECPAKCGISKSDITLGDFWGIGRCHPEVHDEKGVSIVLVHSDKGMKFLSKLVLSINPVSYEQALSGNPSIEKSVPKPKYYPEFWKSFNLEGIDNAGKIICKMKPNPIVHLGKRIVVRIIRLFKR